MPVNIAFGPSAGLVGQFGYGAGQRQYSDRKAEIERQSRRERLADAMNFAKYIGDLRRPEQDQRRALERMNEQQRLQKDTMSHQQAIRRADTNWEQNRKEGILRKQNEAIVELDKRLKREMENLPADFSPLEKQHWYQRQYDLGSHAIGVAKAPGADIKPFEHYEYGGKTFRVNPDRSIVNVDAEEAKVKTETRKQNIEMIKGMTTARMAVRTEAAKPFDDEISALREQKNEIIRNYEGPASRDSTVPSPQPEDFREDGKVDHKALAQAVEKWKKTETNKRSIYDNHHKSLANIDRQIREQRIARRRAINFEEMKLYQSLGGEENIGGSPGKSLFDDTVREQRMLEQEAHQEAVEQEDRDTYRAAFSGDRASQQRFIEDPPEDIIDTEEWYPGERQAEAARLLDPGGPDVGPSFKLDSGKSMPASMVRQISENPGLRQLYQDEVTDKDIDRLRDEHPVGEKPVTEKVPVPNSGGKKSSKARTLPKKEVKAIHEASEQVDGLRKMQKLADREMGKPSNKRLAGDFKKYKEILGQMEEIQSTRHKMLFDGMGDLFARENFKSENSLNIKYAKLQQQKKDVESDLEKESKGELAGETYRKQIEEFRAAGKTFEGVEEGWAGLIPPFAADTPGGWLQRKLAKRAADVHDIYDWFSELKPPEHTQEETQ